MAGNVNEWVQDTYRQMTFEDVDDFNPFRGNEFVDKRLADPATGKYAKDKYGLPIKDPAKSAKKMSYAELIASQQAGAQTTQQKDPLAGKPYNPDARGYL